MKHMITVKKPKMIKVWTYKNGELAKVAVPQFNGTIINNKCGLCGSGILYYDMAGQSMRCASCLHYLEGKIKKAKVKA